MRSPGRPRGGPYAGSGGELTSMTDPDQHTTHYSYDGSRRLIETIFPNGTTEEETYDDAGDPLTDAEGTEHSTTTDGRGNVIETVDGDGNASYTSYDAAGFVTQAIDGMGTSTVSQYDTRGWLTSETEGANAANPRT